MIQKRRSLLKLAAHYKAIKCSRNLKK